MARPHRLIELTSPELAALAGACRLVGKTLVALLPVGSIEQHGPALPLGTDTFLAEESCLSLAAAFDLPDRFRAGQPGLSGVVLPPITYTNTDTCLDFPGTLTVPHAIQREYGLAVLRSCLDLDVGAVVAVNGHGPNDSWLMEAAFQLNQETLRVYHGLRPAMIPVSVGNIFRRIYQDTGLPAGKHADWLELCVLYGLRGDRLFQHRQEALAEHMALRQPADFPIPGIPMRTRSATGVLGQGWPGEFDLDSLSSQVFDMYFNFLTQQIREAVSAAHDYATPPGWRTA